jgi:hypothetical protein
MMQDGPFVWDISTRNLIIGSFFYGYMVLQFPGGRVAELFGGKRVRMQTFGARLTFVPVLEFLKHAGRGGGGLIPVDLPVEPVL